MLAGEPPVAKAPCEPSPCGPNAVCRVSGDSPSCSCLPNYYGSPPYCRPECVTNSECSFDKSCINNKCADPCLGACGQNAECRVVSHSPQCRCQPGYEGNSFDQCLPMTGIYCLILLFMISNSCFSIHQRRYFKTLNVFF